MQWPIQGRGPGGPTPAYFQSNGLEDPPPPAPYLKVWIWQFNAALASRRGGGGGGTPIHYIIIRVCAAQRGCDFEASDLERCIHYRGVF